jgi:hypothetical protein
MLDIEDQGDVRITKENYKDYINTLFFKALLKAIKYSSAQKLAVAIVLTPDGRLKLAFDGIGRMGYMLGLVYIVDPDTATRYYYILGFNAKWNDPSVVIPDTKNGFKEAKIVKQFFAMKGDPEAYQEHLEWVDQVAQEMEWGAERALDNWERMIARGYNPVPIYKQLGLNPENMLPDFTYEEAKDDPLLIT